MKWLVTLILVGIAASGCKSQTPVTDPFFGRTTIPPPPTGSVNGRPNDPGYQPPSLAPGPSSPASNIIPPAVQLPSQPSAQSAPLTAPPTTSQSAPLTVPPATNPLPAAGGTGVPPAIPQRSGMNYSAPRPWSTMPASAQPQRSSTPAGNYYNRGGAAQSSAVPAAAPANPQTSAAPVANVATIRSSGAVDDRTPRPIDDAAADGGAAGGSASVRTSPLRDDNSSNRAVDISDLPKAQ